MIIGSNHLVEEGQIPQLFISFLREPNDIANWVIGLIIKLVIAQIKSVGQHCIKHIKTKSDVDISIDFCIKLLHNMFTNPFENIRKPFLLE